MLHSVPVVIIETLEQQFPKMNFLLFFFFNCIFFNFRLITPLQKSPTTRHKTIEQREINISRSCWKKKRVFFLSPYNETNFIDQMWKKNLIELNAIKVGVYFFFFCTLIAEARPTVKLNIIIIYLLDVDAYVAISGGVYTRPGFVSLVFRPSFLRPIRSDVLAVLFCHGLPRASFGARIRRKRVWKFIFKGLKKKIYVSFFFSLYDRRGQKLPAVPQK